MHLYCGYLIWFLLLSLYVPVHFFTVHIWIDLTRNHLSFVCLMWTTPPPHRRQLLSLLEEILLLAGILSEGIRRHLYLAMIFDSIFCHWTVCGGLVARRSFVILLQWPDLLITQIMDFLECCTLHADPVLQMDTNACTAHWVRTAPWAIEW